MANRLKRAAGIYTRTRTWCLLARTLASVYGGDRCRGMATGAVGAPLALSTGLTKPGANMRAIACLCDTPLARWRAKRREKTASSQRDKHYLALSVG